MNRIYIILVCLTVGLTSFAEQKSDSTRVKKGGHQTSSSKKTQSKGRAVKYPNYTWGFSTGLGTYGITLDNQTMDLSNNLSFTGGVFGEIRIKEWLGAEIGAHYTFIGGNATKEGFSGTINSIDDEDWSYVHMIEAREIEEEMEAGLLEIPISAKFFYKYGKWDFYLKPGVAYTLIIDSKYTQKAQISVSGYYESGNVHFDNLPQHGYFPMSNFQSSGELALKSTINPFIGAGAIFPSKAGNFFLECKYYPGVIDFSNGEGNGTLFEGPMDNREVIKYQFESITEEADKVTLGGFLVQIGLKF